MPKLSFIFFLIFGVQAFAQPVSPKPGTVFRDGANFPEMVVIPAGKIFVGPPAPDELRWHQASTPPDPPPHEVNFVQPFAIAKYPVTISQWDDCVAAGGCKAIPPQEYIDPRAGPDAPVTYVSFFDAQSYVVWLNKLTTTAGKSASYALPSEAQWEYAATAGAAWTDPAAYSAWLAKLPALGPRPEDNDWPFILLSGLTPEAWQNFMRTNSSNDGFPFMGLYYGMWFRPHAVEKMFPNSFGVAGMLAPNAEWTLDCWSNDFTKPPPATCQDRVVHGEWGGYGMTAYPTDRTWRLDTLRLSKLGFRVVRTLP